MNDLGDNLWNADVDASDYAAYSERYRAAILEQYKLCVEMADRVSARRNLTNTFFLSLNSAAVVILAAAPGNDGLSRISVWALLPGLVVLLAQCATWFAIVRSYRQLNSAKYQVIGALEERLPAFAYSRAEWRLLGEGRDWRVYLPLTHVEQWVPIIFSAAYLLGFVVVSLS